jgi:hypothetical protein
MTAGNYLSFIYLLYRFFGTSDSPTRRPQMAMFMLPGFRLSEGEVPGDPVSIRINKAVTVGESR